MGSSSNSDSDSEWNKEMFIAVTKKQGKGRKITEQDRCRQIEDCIDRGAKINALDKNGNTVLDIAVVKGYQEVATFLRRSGAQPASIGYSRLDCAAERLATNLDKLDIANVPNDGKIQKGKETGLQWVDHGKPSTSGIARSLPEQDSAPSRATWHPKHKLIADTEHDVVAKKRRIGSSGSKSISSDEDPSPEEGEESIVQRSYFDPNERYTASGLKQTLHGIVYQWKHLMLVMNRAWRKGYSFRLSTEMDAAEKFDDLVLEYVDSAGKKTHRFVQLKHKKDNAKMVGARDLLDAKDGDFSVLKYFVSWRKIKESSDFGGSSSKTFTLCTNIGLDVEGLRKAHIAVSAVTESDDFLEVTNRVEQPPRYRLQVSRQSELYHTLKFASDAHRLAMELAERVFGSKDIHLNTEIMKRYHTALAQEVVDVGSQNFAANFITSNNLSDRAKNFREILLLHAKKLSKLHASEKDIWKRLTRNKLKISSTFGTKSELAIDPQLTQVARFSDEFIKLINNASNNVVKIDRRIYSKRASDSSVERVFADNIDMLAGHVLITDNKRVKFSSQFLNDATRLMGNMGEFRDVLKTRLGSGFSELDKFEFEISNFKTCTAETSVTELPNDDISDGEILDFLNGFVLAVDQPDEIELGEMIRKEIGDGRFDLPDAKFITDSFQMEILDWFKETGKQSVFLGNKNAKDIFDEIEGRLSSIVTMDLRSEYPEKLESLGITFRSEITELWKFVQSPSQMLVISSEQTLLTSLRVYQTLKSLQRSGPHGGFIFVRLERLFETDILDQVLRTFEWRDKHNLLIVDCESISVQQYARALWNPVCNIVKKNGEKKVVLIIRNDQDSTMKFRVGYDCVHEKDGDFNIVNLDKISRQKLLERRVVKFQGEKESFGRLLRAQDFGNIGSKRLRRLKRIIDSDTLVQLVKGKEIQIGNEVEGLGPVQDYYIPRRIVRYVVIKADIFKASGNMTDLFAISGADQITMRKLLGNEERLRSFDENSRAEPDRSECIILANGEEANQFESLCRLNLNRNIHWLDGASGKLIWKRTYGDINNLLKYKDYDEHKPDSTFPNEEQLVDHDPEHRIVIFSDTAGMGKSTLLTSLAEKMKGNMSEGTKVIDRPPLFMIRINLTQHTTVLSEERASRTFDCDNIDGAIDFLVDKLSGIDKSDDLASRVYKTMIKDDGEAALFFDGFDEISPTYEHIVMDLLRALVRLPIKKLFVASRPHTGEELEKKLATFSHRLEPFSPDDQRNFLKKFWKRGMIGEHDYDEARERRLEMHADGVMKLLARSINHQMTEFTGVPLQTKMVAEIYQYCETGRKECCDVIEAIEDAEKSRLRLPDKIDIIDLYQKFVDKKYDVFFTEKQPGDPTNLAARQSRKDGHFMFMMKHQKFALGALFDEEAVCAMLNSQPGVMELIEHCQEEDHGGVERAGIVTLDVVNKPHFIHRTFAEYFAATFLAKTLTANGRNQDLREFFVAELFVETQYRTIRAFVNCLLSRGAYTVEHEAWRLDLCKNPNTRDYETVYYVAAKERNFEILRFLLNCLTERSEKNLEAHETGVNISDYGGKTPLSISIENSCDIVVAKCFIDRGVDPNWKNFRGITLLHTAAEVPDNLALVKYLCDEGADVNHQDQKRERPLHYAARHGRNLSVVKYLCDNGADVNCQEMCGETPLHHAARHAGNADVVKYLRDKGADINLRNHASETALHLAAQCAGNLEVVKYLLDQGADVNCQLRNGRTPLHCAADDAKKLDVVKYLCENGAGIDCQDHDGETPLHLAARCPGNSDVVKYLCDKGANLDCQGKNAQSPLHCAALHAENLTVVKCLREKGADTNCQDEKGDTPLHYAVRHFGNLETVKYLCENGADINFQQRDGRTPLYCAADSAIEIDAVKYLCDKGADVNLKTRWGETPLHRAAFRAENSDVVKYLCEKGASIRCQNESGETPLHNAARFGRSLAVKYLCENGANVNIQDAYGRTSLHCAAAEADKLDAVKYLCDNGADVNLQDKSGDTPLHWATRSRANLHIVKYFCDKGASINCQNEKGETPLHFAASKTQYLDVVKYLCENGASINCQSKLGAIPLHEAARQAKNLDVVKYLCENGANIDCQLTYGWTPLHCAADQVENFEILKYLCDMGANVNSHSNDGETPLLRAVLHGGGDLDTVKYLCEKGADVNCKYSNGETPLHQAILEACGLDVVTYLINKSADINAKTSRGCTPLHTAVELWQWKIVQCLIQHGADASITDEKGNTPLSLARYRWRDSDMLQRAFGNQGDASSSSSSSSI